MIKLIATDMDGTLLDANSKINPEFDEVFKKLLEKDIKFAVASGRQYMRLREDFKEYAEDIVFIGDNGSIVMYRDKEIFSQTMKDGDVDKVIKGVRDLNGSRIVLSGKKEAYFYTHKIDMIEEIEKYYKQFKIIHDFEAIDDQILKIAIYVPEDIDAKYKEFLKEDWSKNVKISVSGANWIDIYNKNTNKGVAMNKIQEKFGISRDETMAFGDYYNDVELLEEAAHSYAMENSPENFKQYARFIAKSNEENGVLEMIKEKVL